MFAAIFCLYWAERGLFMLFVCACVCVCMCARVKKKFMRIYVRNHLSVFAHDTSVYAFFSSFFFYEFSSSRCFTFFVYFFLAGCRFLSPYFNKHCRHFCNVILAKRFHSFEAFILCGCDHKANSFI